ncbi:hypothetical protein LCGC14_1621420, partial [marine sediment metagenome]
MISAGERKKTFFSLRLEILSIIVLLAIFAQIEYSHCLGTKWNFEMDGMEVLE